MIKIEDEYWINYYAEGCEYSNFDLENFGKWMYFYNGEDGYNLAAAACEECVDFNIVLRAKHKPKFKDHGVACFYVAYDDIESHKKVISYLIDNNMVRKTKTGKYSDISFKLNTQTALGQYGQDYTRTLTLSNFIDLDTGKWLV